MFKDDNTIIHFSKPEGNRLNYFYFQTKKNIFYYFIIFFLKKKKVMSSIQSSAFVVMGKAETKSTI